MMENNHYIDINDILSIRLFNIILRKIHGRTLGDFFYYYKDCHTFKDIVYEIFMILDNDTKMELNILSKNRNYLENFRENYIKFSNVIFIIININKILGNGSKWLIEYGYENIKIKILYLLYKDKFPTQPYSLESSELISYNRRITRSLKRLKALNLISKEKNKKYFLTSKGKQICEIIFKIY